MTSESSAASSPREPSTRRSLALVYAGYAFRYLYLLILIPFYGRVLGAAEYGRVLAGMSLFQVVWSIAEYGFPGVGMRDVAATNTAAERAQIYGEQLAGRLLTTACGLLVGVLGTLLSPLLREQPLFGVLATLNGVVAAFNLGWYFQGTLRFATSVALEILGFALNLALIIPLVHDRGDGWIVLAALVTSGTVCTVTAHVLAVRSFRPHRVSLTGGLRLVRSSTALFAARGLSMLTSSSSTLLISLVAPAVQVGWYGGAERLASAGLSLLQPANQVFIGTVSKRLSHATTRSDGLALIRKSIYGLTGFSALMTVGTLLLSGFAVPLILGPEFESSVSLLQILSLMFPFTAFVQVVEGYVLIPMRLDRWVPIVSFVGAVSTVLLTLALGYPFQGLGVSVARVVTSVLMALAIVEILRRNQLLLPVLREGSPAPSSAPAVVPLHKDDPI